MIDLDDLFEALLDVVGLRNLPASKRAQGCVRVGFGMLLFGLSLAGVWRMLGYPASPHFRIAGAALFTALAAFGLLNIVLQRRWRWPGCLVLLALFSLFAARIVLGP